MAVVMLTHELPGWTTVATSPGSAAAHFDQAAAPGTGGRASRPSPRPLPPEETPEAAVLRPLTQVTEGSGHRWR